MGRLYYEKQSVRRNSSALDKDLTPEPGNSGLNFTEYLNKVSSLIPGEIVAGYLTMFGFISAIKNARTAEITIWIIFALGLILTPLYLNKVADPGKPKRNHLILSSFAFVVWAYVTTGEKLLETIFPEAGLFDQAMASIILIGFSLVSAVIPLNK